MQPTGTVQPDTETTGNPQPISPVQPTYPAPTIDASTLTPISQESITPGQPGGPVIPAPNPPTSSQAAQNIQSFSDQYTQNPPTPPVNNDSTSIPSPYASTVAELENQTGEEVQGTEETQSGLSGAMAKVIGQLGQVGAQQAQEEEAANIPQEQQQLASINTQIAAENDSYNNKLDDLYGANAAESGATVDTANSAANELTREHARTLANLTIAQTAVTNDYTSAEAIIQHKADLETEDLKSQLDGLTTFFNANQSLLTQQQQEDFQAKLQDTQNAYDQKKTDYQNIGQAQFIAAQNGAPMSVINAMGKASNLPDALSAGGQFIKTGDYQLIPSPTTGLPVIFNTKTGQVADGSATPTAENQTVTGTDGSQYDLSTYAPNDSTYGQQVSSAISSLGTIPNANSAQAAISLYAPKSAISGDMLVSAAQSANVNPSVLGGVLKVESNFGTQGSGSGDNNPGNVKFVGQPNATQGPAAQDGGYFANFSTMQDGVNAAAQELANRKSSANQNVNTAAPTGQPTTVVGKISAAQNTIQNAPVFLQGGALSYAPSTGDLYIQASKLPSGLTIAAQNYAANNGNIPILSDSQVASVQQLDTALNNLDNIQNQWTSISPGNSLGGRALSGFTGTFATAFNTSRGNRINAYNSTTVPSAIDAINAITNNSSIRGVAPIAQNSLPQLGLDTLIGGQTKIDAVRTQINNALKSIIPSSAGAPLSTAAGSALPTTGAIQQYHGATYSFDGTQWVKQ